MSTAESTAPLQLPAQLQLVQRWVNALGMSTRQVEGTAPDGTKVAALEIHRGPNTIAAFSPPISEPFVILKLMVNLPASLRATIGKLGADSRRQLSEAVFGALQSNPRSGYQLIPPGSQDLTDVQQFSLEQAVRVSENDAGTFNRLADAIQELVTGYVLAGRQIALFVKGPTVEGTSRFRPDTPTDMFR